MQKRTKNALILIAYGSEDMEVVITADILRRAGISVTIAGESQIVTCSRGVKIIPESLFDDILEEDQYDAVILPGGARGVENLGGNPHIERLIQANYQRGSLIGAMCAAPLLLAQFGIIQDIQSLNITSHPSVEPILRQTTNARYLTDGIVESRGIITSRGAGSSFEFAIAIVRSLVGENMVDSIVNDIFQVSFTQVAETKDIEITTDYINEDDE